MGFETVGKMGDYFDDDLDNGHDTAGIVIDDYDDYDEEYFGDDGGAFSQEDNSKPLAPVPSERLAGRLSVDTAAVSGALLSGRLSVDSTAGHTNTAPHGAVKGSENVTETITEEVEEIEEVVEEEEENDDDDEEDDEGRERFNRTEVSSDARSSVLNRLGPK